MTKFFRIQLEYMDTRRVKVTVCNVLASLTGEILASFLSAYSRFEKMLQFWSAAGIPHGDYVFRICLTREGFQAIPDTIPSQERQMMGVVEGWHSLRWNLVFCLAPEVPQLKGVPIGLKAFLELQGMCELPPCAWFS